MCWETRMVYWHFADSSDCNPIPMSMQYACLLDGEVVYSNDPAKYSIYYGVKRISIDTPTSEDNELGVASPQSMSIVIGTSSKLTPSSWYLRFTPPANGSWSQSFRCGLKRKGSSKFPGMIGGEIDKNKWPKLPRTSGNCKEAVDQKIRERCAPAWEFYQSECT